MRQVAVGERGSSGASTRPTSAPKGSCWNRAPGCPGERIGAASVREHAQRRTPRAPDSHSETKPRKHTGRFLSRAIVFVEHNRYPQGRAREPCERSGEQIGGIDPGGAPAYHPGKTPEMKIRVMRFLQPAGRLKAQLAHLNSLIGLEAQLINPPSAGAQEEDVPAVFRQDLGTLLKGWVTRRVCVLHVCDALRLQGRNLVTNRGGPMQAACAREIRGFTGRGPPWLAEQYTSK